MAELPAELAPPDPVPNRETVELFSYFLREFKGFMTHMDAALQVPPPPFARSPTAGCGAAAQENGCDLHREGFCRGPRTAWRASHAAGKPSSIMLCVASLPLPLFDNFPTVTIMQVTSQQLPPADYVLVTMSLMYTG